MIGNICSQICGEKPLVRVGKTGPKTLLKSYLKQPPNAPFYRARKTSRWGSDRPVGRPASDRQRSKIRPLSHRSTGRSTEVRIQRASLSVRSTARSTGQRSYFRPLSHRSTGRSTVARIQRASLSVRLTGRSTGAFPESRALWTADRVGRPALLPELACTSVHVGRSLGRPPSGFGRPVGRPAEARTEKPGTLN